MSNYQASVCPHDCPSACALEVECIDAQTIGKVRGAKDNDYTLGVVCSKVAHYSERVHHPERLQTPMLRVGKKGEGKFKPIDWEDALDRVSQAFSTASTQYGPESVWPYYYGGTMGQIQRYGTARFKNALGYSGLLGTICVTIAYAGWRVGAGSVRGADPRTIANSDLVVIWGSNAVATQVNLMKHVARAQRQRGAKIVVIDPARTGTAKKADVHLAVRPGTDGALAAAVMHCAFRDNLADWQYLRRMSDDPQGLQNALHAKTTAWAAGVTGLSVTQIERFAALYNSTKRSFIRLGIGFSRSRNGAHNVHSVACLPVVTGAWQHEGGGALLGISEIFKLDKTFAEGLDMLGRESRDLDMPRIGAILTGNKKDLKGGPPVKAMLIQNTNPMSVAPDLKRVREGLAREDLFVCVHEQFMTETAKMADVLLPATTSMEHDDLYTSYGQPYLQVAVPVIEPFAQSRSNHEVICQLARRLGVEDKSFTMSAKNIIARTLADSEYPDYKNLLANKWHDCSEGVDMQFQQGFDWPDGKFRLRADWSAVGEGEGMPEWPGHWAVTECTSDAQPYRLTTPPARRFLNSSFTQSPSSRKAEGQPRLNIHPTDAEKEKITDASLVEIGNSLGCLKLTAQITDAVLPGVVEARGIWPGDAYEAGLGINSLISAQAIQPDGGVAFHDATVWLRAV